MEKSRKCLVNGCASVEDEHAEDVSFFKLPNDDKLRYKWLVQCKREDLVPFANSLELKKEKICSRHFGNRMFEDDARTVLKSDAYPALYVWMSVKDQVFSCPFCTITYHSRDYLDMHKKYCRARCVIKEEVARNESVNDEVGHNNMNDGPIDLSLAALESSVRRVEVATSKNGAPKKIHACPICPYSTQRKCSLVRHSAVHTGVKPWKCDECDYSCSQENNLKRHMKIHVGFKPYACPVCHYRSTERAHLKSHLLTHSNVKPYSCQFCHYKCTLPGNLKRHLRVHTGEKRFSCQHCSYTCKEKCNLRDHLMTHAGEKPYMCAICNYRCTQASNLKSHIRSHSGIKPFLCELCGYRCTRAGNLKDHKRIHTGERPYKCDECDYRSTQASHLKTHMKTHFT